MRPAHRLPKNAARREPWRRPFRSSVRQLAEQNLASRRLFLGIGRRQCWHSLGRLMPAASSYCGCPRRLAFPLARSGAGRRATRRAPPSCPPRLEDTGALHAAAAVQVPVGARPCSVRHLVLSHGAVARGGNVLSPALPQQLTRNAGNKPPNLRWPLRSRVLAGSVKRAWMSWVYAIPH